MRRQSTKQVANRRHYRLCFRLDLVPGQPNHAVASRGEFSIPSTVTLECHETGVELTSIRFDDQSLPRPKQIHLVASFACLNCAIAKWLLQPVRTDQREDSCLENAPKAHLPMPRICLATRFPTFRAAPLGENRSQTWTSTPPRTRHTGFNRRNIEHSEDGRLLHKTSQRRLA